MPTLKPQACLRIVPRRGFTADECEDAGAVGTDRFAVADGASESAHAGTWARLLAEGFVQDRSPWPGWITPLQERWAKAVARPADAEPTPWYLDGREEQGAFATFVGVSIVGDRWQAVAVGDTCVFHVSAGKAVAAYPLDHSSQFGNTPVLIGSRPSADQTAFKQAVTAFGDLRPGDRLWIMTDALARWYLERIEKKERPWELLEDVCQQPEEDFAGLVGLLRSSRQLRNDDTTLLAILV